MYTLGGEDDSQEPIVQFCFSKHFFRALSCEMDHRTELAGLQSDKRLINLTWWVKDPKMFVFSCNLVEITVQRYTTRK